MESKRQTIEVAGSKRRHTGPDNGNKFLTFHQDTNFPGLAML